MGIRNSLTMVFMRGKIDTYAGVAQLFRALPCQGRGRELESLRPHQLYGRRYKRHFLLFNPTKPVGIFCFHRGFKFAMLMLRRINKRLRQTLVYDT